MASEAAISSTPKAGNNGKDVQQGHDTELLAKARFSKQMIEQKERELNEYISLNYNHIKDVERELQQLAMQVKLTADPKKHAMELLRKKIETQNNKVQAVHKRYVIAKQAYDDVAAELQREEAAKQQLCDELNELVTTSVSSQLERFEQLKAKLQGMMNPGASIGRTHSAPAQAAAESAVPAAAADGSAAEPNCTPAGATEAQGTTAVEASSTSSSCTPAGSTAEQQEQQQAEDDEQRKREAIKAAAAAAAAALRAKQQAEAEEAQRRHVQLPGNSSNRGRQQGTPANQQRLMQKQQRQQQQQQKLEAEPQQAASVDVNGRFAGFDA